jgi:pimeloyl-ACP methyl ester carboxylesterase
MSNATIVLVHGAFADGGGWGEVIPLLEERGFEVTAVQNPLTSFADDVATTQRVIDAQSKPVILVGHSYGGAVITAAAVDRNNVKALVYVQAFGPDEGENLQELLTNYPSRIGTALVPDAAGFLYIDRSRFAEVFAADVSTRVLSVMSASQKPIKADIFGHKFGTPAWKNIPSWYLIGTDDQAINPELQRVFAKRMNATTHEGKSSHVPFASHPSSVVDIIAEAADAVTPRAATG